MWLPTLVGITFFIVTAADIEYEDTCVDWDPQYQTFEHPNCYRYNEPEDFIRNRREKDRGYCVFIAELRYNLDPKFDYGTNKSLCNLASTSGFKDVSDDFDGMTILATTTDFVQDTCNYYENYDRVLAVCTCYHRMCNKPTFEAYKACVANATAHRRVKICGWDDWDEYWNETLVEYIAFKGTFGLTRQEMAKFPVTWPKPETTPAGPKPQPKPSTTKSSHSSTISTHSTTSKTYSTTSSSHSSAPAETRSTTGKTKAASSEKTTVHEATIATTQRKALPDDGRRQGGSDAEEGEEDNAGNCSSDVSSFILSHIIVIQLCVIAYLHLF